MFGPNPAAKTVNVYNFEQAWSQTKNEVDLPTLAAQLGQLLGSLQLQAKRPDDFHAIAEVASAAGEAKLGNGGKVMEHLARAGKWTLNVAEKLGIEVAAKVIARALGIVG